MRLPLLGSARGAHGLELALSPPLHDVAHDPADVERRRDRRPSRRRSSRRGGTLTRPAWRRTPRCLETLAWLVPTTSPRSPTDRSPGSPSGSRAWRIARRVGSASALRRSAISSRSPRVTARPLCWISIRSNNPSTEKLYSAPLSDPTSTVQGRYSVAGCLTTRPTAMTKSTCCMVEMSSSGLPSIAIRSARRPSAICPRQPGQQRQLTQVDHLRALRLRGRPHPDDPPPIHHHHRIRHHLSGGHVRHPRRLDDNGSR